MEVDLLVNPPTDVELCQLYYDALTFLLGHSPDKDMYGPFQRYFDVLLTETNSWCEFYNHPSVTNNDMAELLMDTLFYRLAYVYRNSTLLSSAVAFHLHNVLMENSAFLQKLFLKREVKICSLGGGPASDVVAVVKVLDAIFRARGLDMDILVTVIDVDSGWENTCYGVLSRLERFRNAVTKVNFIKTDLSKFYTDETLNAIQSADIVSMVKFYSEFLGTRQDLQHLIEVLTDIMHPGSLLFFLDRPKKELIKPCGDYTGKLYNFDLLYEEVCELHGLDTAAVECNYHLYNKLIGANVFNTCLKVFVRVWLKKDKSSTVSLITLNRSRFRKQKFDGKEYFKLERRFWENKLGITWGEKCLHPYLSSQYEIVLDLERNLKKVVESAKSVRESVIVECHKTGCIGPATWEKYLRSKMDESFLKRAIYCELVINTRDRLKEAFVRN